MDNILKYTPLLLDGLWMTVRVGLSALALGIVFGLIGAAGKLTKSRFVPTVTHGVTNVFRGVPELVIIYIIYYDLPKLLSWLTGGSVNLNPYGAGTIALALVFGAYASETFRGAFLAVPAGQLEAARAFGMTRLQVFRRVHLPQMWRFALPGLSNLWVVLIKDSSLVSLIGLEELMRASVIAQRGTREPFTFYSLAGLIYIGLTVVSTGIGHLLEKRAQRGVRVA
ncbi:ABC transporter permease [Lacibacterium aquatile]|uniref:ABC transporter permease n=1 Tax=Lacibacterium aquatile TaxID=1168082 RepID=A0ABW5DU62_9PROT